MSLDMILDIEGAQKHLYDTIVPLTSKFMEVSLDSP